MAKIGGAHMIKTKFVFAVSLVSLMVVNSAMAASVTDPAPVVDANKAPISGTVGTLGDVYDWSEAIDGHASAGIAGVSYVNKAVDAAGNAAQWAENHAAAAGTAAVNAAESAANAAAAAAEAAQAAADAAQAVAGKQDVLKGAQLDAVNSGITSGKVATYDAYADQIAGKQEELSQAQLNAVNSGITSEKVLQYDAYATLKQDKLSYTAENAANKADAITDGMNKQASYPTVALMETSISTANTELGIEIATAAQAAANAQTDATSALTKIDGMDVSTVTGSGNVVTSVTQTDGKITVKKETTLGSLATKSTVTSSEITDGAVTAAKTSGVIGKLPSGSETAAALASIWVQ